VSSAGGPTGTARHTWLGVLVSWAAGAAPGASRPSESAAVRLKRGQRLTRLILAGPSEDEKLPESER
jgi:hypothetical protein